MHNQTFTDDSECCSTIGLQKTQKGPCHTSLYLPALAPGCSSHQVQDTDAAFRTATGLAPSYFHSLLRIYIPFRSLRSASKRCLVVPSQRGSKSLSRTFSCTFSFNFCSLSLTSTSLASFALNNAWNFE